MQKAAYLSPQKIRVQGVIGQSTGFHSGSDRQAQDNPGEIVGARTIRQ